MKTVEIKNDKLARAWTELTDAWRDLRDSCDLATAEGKALDCLGEFISFTRDPNANS